MKYVLIILLIQLIILTPACDIFESREPESPDQTKSSYRVPFAPSVVIENMMNSFKDKNANDYKKNFSSGLPLVDKNFFFVPSSNVLPNFPTDWTVNQEFQYFNNLVLGVPNELSIQLTFTDELYEQQADSAVYSAKYLISVPVQNAVPKIYEGNVRFFMTTDINSAWVIYFWEDIAQIGATWSELKLEFYL